MLLNERLSAIVGARISEFRRKMAQVKKTIKSLPNNTRIKITAVTKEAEKSIQQFQSRLERLASFISAFGTVARNFLQGGLLIVSPSAIPIIASAIGALGALIPIAGTAAGAIGGLAAAFGIAGGAAVAFGAAAMPTIQGIIDGTAKATAENTKAMKQLEGLKNAWKNVQNAIAPDVAIAFGNAMEGVRKAVQALNPMFTSMAKTVSNLSARFNEFMGSNTAKNFFNYLNKNAAPIFEKLANGAIGFVKGMMNLTVAFGPLIDYMAQGFSNLGNSFASMNEKFANSKAVQNFIAYVRENGPKLMNIFGNIVRGITGIGVAFAPFASDMLTGLQNITAKFAQWGQTLSENQQFQQFVNYVKTNGPAVLDLIGNLTTLLVTLGTQMAPLGVIVLNLTNNVLSLVNSLIQAHPSIGNVIGALIIGVGVFQMLTPLILFTTSLFSGLGRVITTIFPKSVPVFTQFKAAMITGLRMTGQAIVQTSIKFVTSTGKMIASIAKWSARVIASAVKTAAQFAAQIAKMIGRMVLFAGKAAANAARVALSFTVTILRAVVKAAVQFAIQVGKMVARYAFLAAQSMIHAARVAASWVVAMGPVGWVIATIVGLVAIVVANWDKIKNWTKKTWDKVWSTIKSVGNKIKGFFDGLNLYESGKAIIQSAIDGITSMARKIVGKVEDIVGKIRNLWPFSPAKEGPLSDIHRMDFAGPIGKSIDRAKKPLQRKARNLAAVVSEKIKNLEVKFDTKKISARTYINELEKIRKNYKLTGDQARKVAREIYQANQVIKKQAEMHKKTIDTINSKVKSANEKFLNKVKSINDKLKKDIQSLKDEYNKKLQDLTNSIYNQVGLFESVKIEKISADTLFKNLKDQNAQMKQFQADLAKLQKMGVSKYFINELREMGVSAADEINAIANMPKTMLNEYVKAWKEKHALAAKEANIQMADERAALAKQIKNLTTAAKVEIQKAKTDWIANLKKIGSDVAKLGSFRNSGRVLGRDTVKGLINGLKSMNGPLAGVSKSLAKTIEQTVKKTLKIHSPSRVFIAIGAYVIKGLTVGLIKLSKEPIRAVRNVSKNVSAAMTKAFTPKLELEMAGIGATVNVGTNISVPTEYETHSNSSQNDSKIDMSRIEALLEKIANSNQVIVLDSGELVGATYNKYDQYGGNKTSLAERWGR